MFEAVEVVLMAPREGAGGTFVFFLNMTAVILIFYFILIRPQRKEQKKHKEMIAALAKGDEVVTTGGIIGTVIRAEEDRLILRTAGDTKITVERVRIARRVTQES